MNTPAVEVEIKPPARPGMWLWLRKNLFSGWFNTLLTVISVALIFMVIRGMVNWIFFQADWSPVVENLRLYAVGTYPLEEMGRIWIIIYMVSFLIGISAGKFRGTILAFTRSLGIAFIILACLPVSMEYLPMVTRIRLIANPAIIFVGYLIGKKLHFRTGWLALAWGLTFISSIVLLGGFKNVAILPTVESGKWGGLMLTILLAVVGITVSFPIGIFLALGRRSSLPVVKALCIVFIETVRGVPLVTILFMTSILLPLFLPDTIRIDRVLRAMLGMTLFASAYMAENVRGGLQSIQVGQYEAAKAVGLNNMLTTVLIVLPQALRVVIPAIVGQFIALFMDTTLCIIVGLLEILAVGSAIINSNPKWLLLDMEVYSFIGLVFWIFTFSMAYASRRVEEAVGLGER